MVKKNFFGHPLCLSPFPNSRWIISFDVCGNVSDSLQGQLRGLPDATHDDLWVDVVLHKRLAVLQNLCRQENYSGGTIPNLLMKGGGGGGGGEAS